MLGAGIYPITVAEMSNYTKDADQYFGVEEHEQLTTFLALHPENGEIIPDTDGVRILHWPIKGGVKGMQVRVVYYFRDLNMPLYLLAIFKRGERIPLNAEWKEEIRKCVNELVDEHSQRWANIVVRQLWNGKEPA